LAPLLIVVTGPPAAGKSVLASRLAVELGLPLLAKDDVKLALYRALGARDATASRALSAAAFEVLFVTAGRLLAAGAGLVLEANFVRGESESALGPLLAGARAVQIHCAAEREETLRRYSSRVRHEMHFDEASRSRIVAALDAGRHDPLDLPIPTIRVDTTDGYQPELPVIVGFASRAGG
jgi:predicted kinase